MSLENDINKIEKKVEKQSAAMEMLSFAKDQNVRLEKNNKRLFWIWVITFLCLIGTCIYITYLLNDISVVDTDTIEIEGVETIDNSHIKIGDDIWEKSE